MSEVPSPETVRLYRIENPTLLSEPDGITSHKDLKGQWFSPNVDTALNYLRKSTQKFGKEAGPVDGAQLVVAEVPADRLESMHVSANPIAAEMDVENDNYLVPRDGSLPTEIIPLDEVLGDLRGHLGNFQKLKEARSRIKSLFEELDES